MLAVPSLVGAGTVMAAATVGLAFVEPEERPEPQSRPSSPPRKRRLTSDFSSLRFSSPLRPSTSTATRRNRGPGPLDETLFSRPPQLQEQPLPSPLSSHPPNAARPQPATSQPTPLKTTSRRQSFLRHNTDLLPSTRPVADHSRDSVSSNGSWMRRLSIRPISQHGSLQSSIGPDSPTVFSHGSGAPMMSSEGSKAPQLPPNKLVKRGTAPGQDKPSHGSLSRRATTLRRPATSHQRSATLQQFSASGGFSGPPQAPKFSLDEQLFPGDLLHQAPVETDTGGWTSFFHSRATKGSGFGRGIADSPSIVPGPNKRVQLPLFGSKPRAFLVKANMVAGSAVQLEKRDGTISTPFSYGQSIDNDSPDSSSDAKNSSPSSGGAGGAATADETPTKRARRTLSMHFASSHTWISKTGSIRRSKRGSTEATTNPVGDEQNTASRSSSPTLDQPEAKKAVSGSAALDQIFLPPYQPRQQLEPESPAASNNHPKARKRNSSSPLPPLSRLSSFNIDAARPGLTSASSSSGPRRSPHMQVPSSGSSHSHMSMSQSRTVSGEGASTVVSSDLDNHFTSGDDEDADEQSDTMYDSFRTGASARLRSIDTPIEFMFDESPPSTAGATNSKTKRLSIQEILGRSWDADTNIMEEDESMSTPVRASHGQGEQQEGGAYTFDLASFDIDEAQRNLARLSLDDDDDDDWARDEDITLSNHLSPPNSSLNSRRASPMLRHALASIGGEQHLLDMPLERPRSSIFDWVEPTPYHDKLNEVDGHSPRPKTVHGKQELDLRGARNTSRSRPSAVHHHVRSQSVPVVPDTPSDNSKVVPKFGTWGMGTKTVSEDWDDDFDLDESDLGGPVGGKDSAASFSLVVPPQIQTIQNTVKVHSNQIRELSLLVNDLKRLCRHAKELELQDGSSEAKWKEAENIIELAAPDEEDEDEMPPAPVGPLVIPDFDATSIDDRFLDEGFDASSLEHKPSFASLSIHSSVYSADMSKTAVVRERQAVRRRSVFSPEDDIFGGSWPSSQEVPSSRPRTPDQWSDPHRDSAMLSTVIEAMEKQHRSTPVRRRSPVKPSQAKLFFDTNSLQELVKRASHLRDSLSDLVRQTELLTQSPARTPQRERRSRLGNGSPAFTRVFTDPPASPPRRLPTKSHSATTVMTRTSVDSPRMQMMTVS